MADEAHDVVATAREIMSSDCPTVRESETMLAAAQRLISVGTGWLPVVDEQNRFKRVVDMRDVVELVADEKNAATTPLTELGPGEPGISPDTPLEEATSIFRSRGGTLLAVVENEKLVGAITFDEINAYRQLQLVLGPKAAEVIGEISPRDEMYNGFRGLTWAPGCPPCAAYGMSCAKLARRLSRTSWTWLAVTAGC